MKTLGPESRIKRLENGGASADGLRVMFDIITTDDKSHPFWLTDSDLLIAAREEFENRTGGGVGGDKWLAPLCDYEPPIEFRWPEYVTTPRGEEWWIPEDAIDRELRAAKGG